MAEINRPKIRWATNLETNVDGRPNREFIPAEVRLSGYKDGHGIPLEWYNEQFYQVGEALETIEDGYVSADEVLQDNIDSEATTRSQADAALQQSITAEATTRAQADTQIRTDLSPLTGILAQAILQQIYPVGKPYITAGNEDPAVQLGFGTWVKRSGFIVGQEDGDTDFDTVGEEGGSKTHTHSFSDTFTTSSDGGETLTIPTTGYGTDGVVSNGSTSHTAGKMLVGSGNNENTEILESINGAGNTQDLTTSNHTHTGSVSGTTGSTSNLPPYRVWNIWERTA